jgi:hypothetical protein
VKFCKGHFDPETTYKLFCDDVLRDTVLNRLKLQLVECGACAANPKVKLCMAIGHIATRTDRNELKSHFDTHEWQLFDEDWIYNHLHKAADTSFENDIAHVVTKLLVRRRKLL